MALPTSYLTSAKNLTPILDAIRGAQAPDKFTNAFLESLEFKSSSDRLIIAVLKMLGFLDEAGRPKERYFNYLDQTQSAKILAEAIREAYQDLFRVNKKANELSKTELINKLKTLGQGQLSEAVLEKMAMTFQALAKNADFSAAPATDSTQTNGEEAAPIAKDTQGRSGNASLQLGGLVYNIQIVLPESRDPAVYDALFSSLRRHLP